MVAERCIQEGPIAAIKADSTNLTLALSDLREGQREFIALLRDISAQSEQIRTLFNNVSKHDNEIAILFNRMRDVELAPGKQASQFQIYGVSAVIASAIAYAFKRFGG